MAKTKETTKQADETTNDLLRDHCGGPCTCVDGRVCKECLDWGKLKSDGSLDNPKRLARVKLV